MRTRNILISLIVVILLIGAGWLYWYFLMGPAPSTPPAPGQGSGPSFHPLPVNGTAGGNGSPTASTTASGQNGQAAASIPVLRLLSGSPIGGYGVSTTGSTTTVRWVDRGRGNVYEADMASPVVTTLSNTLVPRIVESTWNASLSAFIGSMYQDGDTSPTTVYASLVARKADASTTPDNVTPFALSGKDISGDLIGYAASPDRSKIFMLMDESGRGVGYVSSFDGKGMTRIFSTPLTELNVSWPSANVIAIATKGSAAYGGYLYFVDPKTGVWTKELGPVNGLSAIVSHDGKLIAYSMGDGSSGANLAIKDVSKGSSSDAVIHTLADKCAWGNAEKDMLYCAAPTRLVPGTYPDDWYRGTVSGPDKIWGLNASTGEAQLIASPLDMAETVINGFKLKLSADDGYLFFMNKNDLSLWSLDLVRTQ